jgi:6-phosphogluconate dehydrogenase (decarboxylating)
MHRAAALQERGLHFVDVDDSGNGRWTVFEAIELNQSA